MGALGAQTSWKLDGRLRFVVQIFDFHSVYGSRIGRASARLASVRGQVPSNSSLGASVAGARGGIHPSKSPGML